MKKPMLTASIFLLLSCGVPEEDPRGPSGASSEVLSNEAPSTEADPAPDPEKKAYFGDLHVHTRFSFDAYLMGTRATPDDAYRFGKGEAIEHASGFRMKMKKPLDFLAVTDHAFYLGAVAEAAEGDGPLSELEVGKIARSIETPEDSLRAFGAVLDHLRQVFDNPQDPDPMNDKGVRRNAWQRIVESAERHNEPGRFTTFVGYEYTTSGPEFENLHRNLIFRSARVPDLPFSRLESTNPEDLWAWMDDQRDAGIDAIAIPHNSNGSNGWMFRTTKFDGSPQDGAYAARRMRNEPLVENTQVKGTSDTHPLLSPNDEWADFEIMPIRVASNLPSQPRGSYVREAYGTGLLQEETSGFNPYKFGVIGSSDTHNAAGSFEEDNYWSKTGITDIRPQQRGSVPLAASDASEVQENDPMAGAPQTAAADDGPAYANPAAQYWGASGLAGVWATSNTREDIYNAFRRKETFSTSGPHIKVRFFGSSDFPDGLLAADDVIAEAYAAGVPMGGDLVRMEDAPVFLMWASRDADSMPLQRLQVIKGWLEDGEVNEQVYDVACSDAGEVDPVTHRCPDNEARVDLSSCATTEGKGSAELRALWQDPAFEPDQRAFYYVRVLENPKCRWSTWDAIRAGVEPRADMKAVIQDRAWSSPIWYTP